MARLIERAPTGEVFPAQNLPRIGPHMRRLHDDVLKAIDCFLRRCNRATEPIGLGANLVSVLEYRRGPSDIDRVWRHAPALHPFSLNALRH